MPRAPNAFFVGRAADNRPTACVEYVDVMRSGFWAAGVCDHETTGEKSIARVVAAIVRDFACKDFMRLAPQETGRTKNAPSDDA